MNLKRNYILDGPTAGKKMRRMALEILENNADEKEIVFAGIRESGSVVARSIQKNFEELSGIPTRLIVLSLDKKLPEKVTMS
ncbi:MAG TPA: hypothetical protein VFO70_07250 [Chitinophagaceae bacterium]|nr:hypothetical protein [Chitinophagaceae bacterium]